MRHRSRKKDNSNTGDYSERNQRITELGREKVPSRGIGTMAAVSEAFLRTEARCEKIPERIKGRSRGEGMS